VDEAMGSVMVMFGLGREGRCGIEYTCDVGTGV
jgi:hypothetical protein